MKRLLKTSPSSYSYEVSHLVVCGLPPTLQQHNKDFGTLTTCFGNRQVLPLQQRCHSKSTRIVPTLFSIIFIFRFMCASLLLNSFLVPQREMYKDLCIKFYRPSTHHYFFLIGVKLLIFFVNMEEIYVHISLNIHMCRVTVNLKVYSTHINF